MKKRLDYTPTSQIKSALRQLYLRSRERSFAIRREANTCQKCGRKGSVAKGREIKIEVHHREGIRWDEIIHFIRMELLIDPVYLEVYCKECHKGETDAVA